MSKAILISIKPKWVAKILNGEKTIEVRKNKSLYKATMKLIEEQGYATFLMYCSKSGMLWKEDDWFACDIKNYKPSYNQSGKVVAKFTVRKVVDYPYVSDKYDELIGSCLSEQEIIDYSTEKFDKELNYRIIKTIYAYHIEDLAVFDKPKELSEFKTDKPTKDKNIWVYSSLTKAPQNFCYVESEE